VELAREGDGRKEIVEAKPESADAPRQSVKQDPREQYPKPPFPKQQQEWPGLASKMDPKPDHGEKSYQGRGRLTGRKALIKEALRHRPRVETPAHPVRRHEAQLIRGVTEYAHGNPLLLLCEPDSMIVAIGRRTETATDQTQRWKRRGVPYE
jgi:hypothetical protein